MIRVNIICEGPTEETFVNKILVPHFQRKGILITPRNIGTGNQYKKLRKNLVQWLKNDKAAYVTTLIDLYGMNKDFPGYLKNKAKAPYEKVKAVEAAVKADIEKTGADVRKFLPHFQLHEFEALLFSEPEILQDWLSLDRNIRPRQFRRIRDSFETPEHINDNPNTAPSKRIEKAASSYSKVAEGVLIAEDIGLDRMRKACKHFDGWLNALEALAPEKT